MYVGEAVSKRFRGAFISITLIVFCVGVVLTYAASIFLVYDHILFVIFATNVLLLLCTFDLVESPYYLSMTGQTEEAAKSLKWLGDYTPKEAEEELKIIGEHVEKAMNVFDLIHNFHKPEIYKGFCIVSSLGVVLTLLQSVTTCFANLVFPSTESISSSAFAIGFTALIALASCGSTLVIDRYGRRVLLVCGLILQTITQASIALLYYLHDVYNVDFPNFPWLMFGFITVTFLLLQFACAVPYSVVRGEIFSTSSKSIAIGSNIIFNSLSNTIFSYLFLPIIAAYGIYLNFLIFSITSLVGLLIVSSLLPETKGKSLIEIQVMLQKGH